MKLTQGLFLLLVVVQRISSSSVNRKLVLDHKKEKDAQRPIRSSALDPQTAFVASPLDTHTGYVLTHGYAPQIDTSHLLKSHETLALADTNAYSSSIFNHESLFSPSHGYGDISKLYSIKTYKQPYYTYSK